MKEDVGFFGKIPRDGISRECFERLLKCVLLLEVDILLLYVLGITWFVVVQVLAGIVLLILILIELISLAIHTKELLEYEQETRENSAIVGAPKASKIWLTIFWVRMSVVVLFLLMVGMGIINLTTVLSMQLEEHKIGRAHV